MANLPSGPGQTDSAHSVSIVHATDDPVFERDALTSDAPEENGVFVIEVPPTSTPVDLSASEYTNLRAAIVAGKQLSLRADSALFYRWGKATGSVDERKTAVDTPLEQAQAMAMNERIRRAAPRTATWLIVKSTNADGTYLRITIVD